MSGLKINKGARVRVLQGKDRGTQLRDARDGSGVGLATQRVNDVIICDGLNHTCGSADTDLLLMRRPRQHLALHEAHATFGKLRSNVKCCWYLPGEGLM